MPQKKGNPESTYLSREHHTVPSAGPHSPCAAEEEAEPCSWTKALWPLGERLWKALELSKTETQTELERKFLFFSQLTSLISFSLSPQASEAAGCGSHSRQLGSPRWRGTSHGPLPNAPATAGQGNLGEIPQVLRSICCDPSASWSPTKSKVKMGSTCKNDAPGSVQPAISGSQSPMSNISGSHI